MGHEVSKQFTERFLSGFIKMLLVTKEKHLETMQRLANGIDDRKIEFTREAQSGDFSTNPSGYRANYQIRQFRGCKRAHVLPRLHGLRDSLCRMCNVRRVADFALGSSIMLQLADAVHDLVGKSLQLLPERLKLEQECFYSRFDQSHYSPRDSVVIP